VQLSADSSIGTNSRIVILNEISAAGVIVNSVAIPPTAQFNIQSN